MNRRKLLSLLGIAPAAVATGAVTSTAGETYNGYRGDAMRIVHDAFLENKLVHFRREGPAKPISDFMDIDDDLAITDTTYKWGSRSFTSTRIKVENQTRRTTFYVAAPVTRV